MYIYFMKKLHGFPLDVTFPMCLAPMVGLSHIGLRSVARSYLPKEAMTIWPSEMLSSRRIPSENLALVPESMKEDNEDYWVPQILGNEEFYIAAAIEKLKIHGAKGIDINMGCPVTKALKHNYGVALMGDVNYAARVVDMAVRNTTLPVSVKLRAGFQKDIGKIVDFVAAIEAAGASWVTLHPRTAEQKRRGSADWTQIQKIKKTSKIPIIGNGDIEVYQDALMMMEQTGCDMVMVGRAATARPWIFWQLGHALGWGAPEGKTGGPPTTAEEEGHEFYLCALQMLGQMKKYFKPILVLKKYQYYIRTASVWLEYGHTLFANISKCKNAQEMEVVLHQFFATEQRMMKKTIFRI